MADPQKSETLQPANDNDPMMQKLRSMYDEVAEEPLPSKLLDLLDQLDQAERNR